jgi:hypothetical protein
LLLEKFDISALIAIGMLVEEMITVSLLPLAQDHVNRCRALEQVEDDHSSNNKRKRQQQTYDMKQQHSFFQWTLPPDEAIAKLMPTKIPRINDNNNNNDCSRYMDRYITIPNHNEKIQLPTTYDPNQFLKIPLSNNHNDDQPSSDSFLLIIPHTGFGKNNGSGESIGETVSHWQRIPNSIVENG